MAKTMAGRAIRSPFPEGVPDMPLEITENILARLPVKTLVRFRCVSKSWHSLISSPRFIKLHLKITTADSTLSGHRILLTSCNLQRDSGPFIKYCSIPSLIDGRSTEPEARDVQYPEFLLNPMHRWYVVGCCNGLFCIIGIGVFCIHDVLLWNPSTGFSIPIPQVRIDLNRYEIVAGFGFGYSESSDDYKVLVFIETDPPEQHLLSIMLYSLKGSSWKIIRGLEVGYGLYKRVPYCQCVSASGKLHFLVVKRSNIMNSMIVSFDLDSETCATVEQPNHDDSNSDLMLGVLGGCICVLYDYDGIQTDLWILKEYGVKESWAKVFAIPYDDLPMMFFMLLTLFMLPSGQILLVFDRDDDNYVIVLIYDPNDHSSTNVEISNIVCFVSANVYVESLVSPIAYGNEGMIAKQHHEGD